VIHTFNNFSNPVALHDAMCEMLVYGDQPGQDYDWTHGTEIGLHNVALHCSTVDFDFNLKQLWVPPSRWTMMVRQYIDPTDLDDCLEKIRDRMAGSYTGRKGRGIAILRTRPVHGRGTGRNVRRRWGSCMLNLSFRANPIPTVSLHSRTTYFGYLALVDMAVARTFAYEVGHITGIDPTTVHFVWTMDLAQFHGFRSLAWMLSDEGTRKEMDEDVDRRTNYQSRIAKGNQPGYRKALDGYARILKSDRAGVLYGDESFSSFARIRRRFHTEVYEGGTRNGGKGAFPPLPDTWVSKLDFSPLGQSEDDDE
jgi:hypothetical protein